MSKQKGVANKQPILKSKEEKQPTITDDNLENVMQKLHFNSLVSCFMAATPLEINARRNSLHAVEQLCKSNALLFKDPVTQDLIQVMINKLDGEVHDFLLHDKKV